MEFWSYPTLYSTIRDRVPPELRDLKVFHDTAMADTAAKGRWAMDDSFFEGGDFSLH